MAPNSGERCIHSVAPNASRPSSLSAAAAPVIKHIPARKPRHPRIIPSSGPVSKTEVFQIRARLDVTTRFFLLALEPAGQRPPPATLLPEEHRIELRHRPARTLAGEHSIEGVTRGSETFIVAPKETARGIAQRRGIHGLQ